MHRTGLILLGALFLSACTTPHYQSAPNTQGMAVSAQHLAADTGAEILRRGGNAVDAAVAMGYALAVTDPSCGNLDGGGFMLIRLANGKTRVIEFREKTPQAGTIHNIHLHPQNIDEVYANSITPGTVAGLNYAAKKYGSLPLHALIQPAILYAENGYQLSQGDMNFINEGNKYFTKDSKLQSTYLHQGRLLQAGDTLIQPELARTLKKIAQDGSTTFYQGEIATQIAQAMQAHHAPLNKTDLANYQIHDQQPIECTYKGYHLSTTGAPSYGGIALCEMLNVLSYFPIQNYAPFSKEAMAINLEIMDVVSRDTQKYVGDPAFVNVPYSYLLSKNHAKQLAYEIQQNKRIPKNVHPQYESLSTTSFAVVDKQGNAVSMIYTLNLYWGGGTTLGKLGFFLNNENIDFALNKEGQSLKATQSPNAYAPNKRPASGMSPVMITKNNHLFLTMGTPGGSTIPTQLLLTLENLIDHHMPLQEAVNFPRYHISHNQDYVNVEKTGIPQSSINALAALGFPIHYGSNYKFAYWGGVTAIQNSGGHWIGVVDKRRPGGKVAVTG